MRWGLLATGGLLAIAAFGLWPAIGGWSALLLIPGSILLTLGVQRSGPTRGLVAEAIAEALVVVDDKGIIQQINQRARRLLGPETGHYPVQAWAQKLDLLRPDGTPFPDERFPLADAASGIDVGSFEFRRGQTWVSATASPLRNAGGGLRGAVMTFRDVTTERRVARVLAETRDRERRQIERRAAMADLDLAISRASELQPLLDRVGNLVEAHLPAAGPCVVLWDAEVESFLIQATDPKRASDPTDAFRHHREATQWIVEERQPLTVADVADDPFGPHPMDADYGLAAYAGVPIIDEGQVLGVLYALDRRVRVHSQHDLDFLTTLADATAATITKVRLYERLQALNEALRRRTVELKENERRFRTLADTAPVLIWMAGLDKGLTYVNRPWLEFTGRPLEEELRQGWIDRIHEDDRERVLAVYGSAFDRRTEFKVEFRLRRHDDHDRWLLVTGTPRFAPDGAFVGYIGSCIDITERREVEAELARHREHLEQIVRERTSELESSHRRLLAADRLAAIGTLAAGLGHDMNNVLFPVRCRLEALDPLQVPPHLEDTLQAVSHAVEYLQQLTDGLRLFALDPQKAEATTSTTTIETWWPRVSPLLTKAAGARCRLVERIAEDLPPVRVAPHRLTQALLNLVVNAGEAMPDGGEIRVSAPATEDREHVLISVGDHGAGMSADVQRQAFDPFFTTKTRRLSTGLGLSLVHSVVVASRGTVEIESAPGAGTRFIMLFPAAASEPSPRSYAARGRAKLSLGDARTAAWVGGLLQAAGYDITPDDTSDDCEVWLTDAAPERIDQARSFLAGAATRRIVVFGDSNGAWPDKGVIRVPRPDDLEDIRDAIRRLPVRQGVSA